MKTLVTVLGTRPEIVKFSPLLPIWDRQYRHILVHTGQHYDENMDRIFFRELKLKAPGFFLNVGSASQGVQTARMLERLEPVLTQYQPDGVAVLGDTNSTLAGALVAAKLNIPILHVEAGCRSFNWKMQEEKNRILVDHVSTFLFAPDHQAVSNLKKEGIRGKGTYLVGNTGLDATRRTMKLAPVSRLKKFKIKPDHYVMATIHRAENTDDPSRFRDLMRALNEISKKVPVLFPIHPRTTVVLKSSSIKLSSDIQLLPPLGNLDFIALLKNTLFILSDSGGIQEEAAVVNRPCLILRDETEWTRLVESGKNFLTGTCPDKIIRTASQILKTPVFRENICKRKTPLAFGATQRICQILKKEPWNLK